MIIFCNGSINSVERIIEHLNCIEDLSGLIINRHKCCFLASKYMSDNAINNIKLTSQFNYQQFPFNYLAAPIYTSHKKISFFEPLIEKIQTKLNGWSSNLLSPGGRIILIQSVLMLMINHVFQIREPLNDVVNRIEKIFNKFLWGSRNNQKKTYWTLWEKLYFPWGKAISDLEIYMTFLKPFPISSSGKFGKMKASGPTS
ncbi:hypothetical protein KSP39_PZI007747 [Platanthera zijinensis]|uniref:Uncharacterized protein n=1 Tax=Platanthera zijinensis TaxID=2320716 RepID=A0AAP0BND8_9ASPA